MQIQQLVYFEAVARNKSMNKAADELFISQPSLSKSILKLEKELKICIFNRTNKGVELTGDGKKLYEYTKILLKQINLIEGLKAEKDNISVSISSYPSMDNGRILGEFYNLLKNKVEINFRECRIKEIIDNVGSLISEVGILHINDIQRKEVMKQLKKKHIKYNEIASDFIHVNVGVNNPLYGSSIIDIRDLLKYTVIRMQDDYFSNLCYFLNIDGVKLLDIDKATFVNNNSMIIELLKTTDVFRFSNAWEKEELKKHGIDTIPIKNCSTKISVGWIKREKEELSSEASGFIEIVKRYYLKNF